MSSSSAPQTPTPTVESVLAHARAYVDAIDGKRYSHAQLALTQMAALIRELPDWALPQAVEPAAERVAFLRCGAQMRLANDDGALVVSLRDEETNVVAALVPEEANALRRDLARVLAAIGGAR